MSKFQNLYDKWAQGYDLAFGPFLRQGQKMALNALDVKPQHRVLEVGIGTGLTLPFYRKDQKIDGVDISERMLEKAEKRKNKLGMKNVNLHLMSAENLEFEDNQFDIVYAPSIFSVVHHPEKVLDEMLRVAKPDGTLCVVSHFAGSSRVEKTIDRLTNSLTQKMFSFRMTTPRQVVEGHSGAQVILKKSILILNFGTLYLIKKKG